jgi:very-short-patch-repair endonuclease
MTDAEQRLWSRLRGKQIHGVQFYRQKPIGSYVVDFFAPAAKLVVEVDGGQHFENSQRQRDARRDAYLEAQALLVLRFDNAQVVNELEAVLAMIHRVVQERLR